MNAFHNYWNQNQVKKGKSTDLDRRYLNFYTTPCNGVVSHMELQLGVFGSLPTMHEEMWKKFAHDFCAHAFASLGAMQLFTCVYLHAQTAVDEGDVRTWRIMVILIVGKTQIPPIGASCQKENGADSCISHLNLWDNHTFINETHLHLLNRRFSKIALLVIQILQFPPYVHVETIQFPTS